jgi:hypothetical protein
MKTRGMKPPVRVSNPDKAFWPDEGIHSWTLLNSMWGTVS